MINEIQHDDDDLGPPHKIRKTTQQSTMASPTKVLETIQLEHVPSTHTVHIGVFKDVENSEFLHQQLLSRNAEFEYAFIDASSVCYISSHAASILSRLICCKLSV